VRSKEQYDRRAASLAGSGGLADVLITPEEIETIYQDAVHDSLQTAITLKATVEATRGGNLFNAILDAPEQALDALVRVAKEHFAGVRQTSIAERLERLAPAERDNKIQTANRNAHVLIQVSNSIVVFCPDGKSGHMAETSCCLAKISAKTAAADCPCCNSS
jgi:hypothetical protein